MVWGIRFPTEFGFSRPQGTFVGWEERLLQNFRKLSPCEQAAFSHPDLYYLHIFQCFTEAPGSLCGPDAPPTRRVDTNDAPAKFEISGRYKVSSSLLFLQGLLVVDQDLKLLIETLESTHQFFPLEITMANKIYGSGKYFVLVVGRWLDSFLPEQSARSSWDRDGTEKYFIRDGSKNLSQLAFSTNAIGETHLWQERRITTSFICCSDELQSSMKSSKLQIPNFFKMKEI